MLKKGTFKISGRVQGVGYRYNARREASSLGITGYVRNLNDGNVEIVAAGEETKLQQLLGWCWKGPTMAHVDEVDVEWEEIDANPFTGFEIRH